MNDILYSREGIEEGAKRLWNICQNHIPKRRIPSHNDLEDLLEEVQNEDTPVEMAVRKLTALAESEEGISVKCA